MGFGERFIDMTWRIMADNWYSVIVNGSRHGFLHSTRGLKQGDPLSPALFILGAEVLSRLMNNLYHHPQFHGFYMANHGPQINHLSFADDIFSSGRKQTLTLIMETLDAYEKVSAQLINKHKSHFMIPSNAFKSTVVVNRITGWHAKILSYGGRAVLIKHVIQAMPIHLLSASTPPSTTIKQIQSITANFFWG
ncbi:uncharacterized protein LOC129894218 [Solanum dulcamara]|uniref:uncharacterized protein LOC129894218 n=1 Tax=Solanum dulcamara TaxID=45834 RepID=UPI002485E9ED|nr:uncharacterized protein LOC129894218 [Solanum dulcamara]